MWSPDFQSPRHGVAAWLAVSWEVAAEGERDGSLPLQPRFPFPPEPGLTPVDTQGLAGDMELGQLTSPLRGDRLRVRP